MTTPHLEISDVAVQAARSVLTEAVSIGASTPLPRGADAFIGTERPLLLGATRWAVVSPGGVLVGGSAPAMAAVLGFELPPRPKQVAPEDRKPGDPPPPRWADLVAEAARPAITSFTQAVCNAVISLAALPPDCAATQVSMNESDAAVRSEIGPIPDAVVLPLHTEEHNVRLVIVVPGIFSARVDRSPAEADVRQEGGGVLAKPAPGAGEPGEPPAPSALDRTLSHVPLDLSVEMGRARVPLAHVLHLQDGEVLELQQAIDAPVVLVSDDTPVARGDLEVSDEGTLVLHVTSIPGRPAAAFEPRVMDAAPAPAAAPLADADAATDRSPGDPPVSDADAPEAPPAPDADAPEAPPVADADAPEAPPVPESDAPAGDGDGE